MTNITEYEPDVEQTNFIGALSEVINKFSKENGSDTPDFLLAGYLAQCLKSWDTITKARDDWYGVALEPGNSRFLKDHIASGLPIECFAKQGSIRVRQD